MQFNIKDDELREYVKHQLDAGIRSIVRSEVATLISQEMGKKLKDVTPHSLQVAISGQIEKEVKKVVDQAFHTLNTHGVDSTYKNWDAPTLFVQKIVLGIRDELQTRLWKYVSTKIGFDLNIKVKEKA
jgi:hypothetical protein